MVCADVCWIYHVPINSVLLRPQSSSNSLRISCSQQVVIIFFAFFFFFCKTKINQFMCNLTCCLLLLDIDVRLNVQMRFGCLPLSGPLLLPTAISWLTWHCHDLRRQQYKFHR